MQMLNRWVKNKRAFQHEVNGGQLKEAYNLSTSSKFQEKKVYPIRDSCLESTPCGKLWQPTRKEYLFSQRNLAFLLIVRLRPSNVNPIVILEGEDYDLKSNRIFA